VEFHVRPFGVLSAILIKIPGALAVCIVLFTCAAMPALGESPQRVATTASAGRAAGATPNACSPAPSAPADLAKDLNYRQIVVLAQTSKKLPLAQLKPADLRLYQADKELQIALFQPQTARVGIVVDTSGSMATKLPASQVAIKAVVDSLRQRDEVLLIAFSDRPFLLAGPTNDHAIVIERIKLLHAYGQTAFYDSVMSALDKGFHGCRCAKAMVLISDGMDTTSANGVQQMTDMARKMDVPIYSIGIGNPNIQGFSLIPLFNREGEALDPKEITQLAKDTGGEAFTVAPYNSDQVLEQIAGTIAEKIDNRYTVGFIGDGSTNHLRVEARDHKDIVFKIESAPS
jgi:VWFA-related protein